MGLKEKTTPLLLFSGPRIGIRTHQKIKEPGNNNVFVVFFSDALVKVIFWNFKLYYFITPFSFSLNVAAMVLLTSVSFTY